MDAKEEFGNDYEDPMPPEKVERRILFVQNSIEKYIVSLNTVSRRLNRNTKFVLTDESLHPKSIAERIAYAYFDTYLPSVKNMVIHVENNHSTDRHKIDRHKIIAGKQAAVMSILPLRVDMYTHISTNDMDMWRKKIKERMEEQSKNSGKPLLLNLDKFPPR